MDLRLKIVSLFLVAVPVGLPSQVEDIDEDIQFHSSELDRLRSEIKDFQDRIRETSLMEKSALERLGEIDEEISLVRNLLYCLKKEEGRKQDVIDRAEKEIQDNERQYKDLQDRYARRVVDVYKRGRLSDLEILLDSDSWRQAIYRSKYLKIISDYDRALGDEIQGTLDEISRRRETVKKELRDMERIDREKSVRKNWLEGRRRMRYREIAQFKRNQKEYSEAIKERQDAAKQMEAIIARLEERKVARLAELERRRREEQLLATADFSLLKGRLPWPVEGNVVSRFGNQKNPTLKTVTENTGIDIKGPAGREVRSVHDGIVTTVTYIRGYGNTIIIDHGGSFYTVYTHVTDVEVEENDYVTIREVIAHVGDSGSLEGAKLHFEIWGNRTKLDPELWLRKS